MRRPLTSTILGLAAAITVGAPVAGADDERRLMTANGLLNRGHDQLAVDEYLAYLDGDPAEEMTARYGLGVAYFRLGEYAKAAEQLQRVDDDDFAFIAEARLIRSHCLLSTGRLDDAAAGFDRIVRAHPHHASADDAAAFLAETHYRAKRYTDAVAAAELVNRRWPDSDRRWRAALIGAMSSMALNKHADADQTLTQLISAPDQAVAAHAALLHAQCLHHIGRRPEALRAYQSVLADQDSPYLADAALGAAQLEHAAGRLDQADRLLRQINAANTATASGAELLRARISLDRGDVRAARRTLQSLERSKDAAIHDDAAYWLAKCDLRDDRPTDAAERLEAAIERWPKSPLRAEMRYDLGVSLSRAGDERAAERAFAQFREAYPRHALAPDALHTMASIRHRADDHEAALALCEEFIRTYGADDDLADVEFLAAESEFLLGRYDDAGARLARVEADGDLALLVTLRRGLALDRLGDFAAAEPHLLTAAQSGDPRCAAASLALGQGYFDQARWRDAETWLTAFLETQPDDAAAAHLRLGLAQLRDDRPADALASFDALLRRGADDETALHARFERGQALLALGRTADAERAFQSVLDDDPDSRFASHALEQLGAIALEAGDAERAGDLYARAAEASPDDAMAARAMFQQIQSLIASGDHAQAAAQCAEFIAAFPDAAMTPTAHVLNGVALSRLSRYDDALNAFSAVRQSDDLTPAMRDTLAYEQAFALAEAGDADEARRAYARFINDARSPSLRAHAMLDMAAIDMARDEHDDALETLAQLRDMAELVAVPDDVLEATAYRYGVCAQRLERHDDAAQALGAFHQRWPESDLVASASLICGDSLIRLGRNSQARDHLQRAIERSTSDDVTAPALLRLGQCQAALTQWADSERTYADYLRRFESSELDFQARFGLGWAVENQGRQQEAITWYRQVVDAHAGPTGARAQFQIGECLFAMGDLDVAVRELLRVDILYDYPEWSAAALYEAGRCFEQMGDADKAREQYTLAADRFPDSDWAAMAARRIDALAPASLPGRDD